VDRSEIEAQVLDVIRQCRTLGVPPDQLDDMSALVVAGEPGVGLENLCVQLVEYDAAVPDALVEQIRNLGEAMKIHDKYWKRLHAK
jgi:hypothetical protein